ncbi:MAG: aspartate aminotransferase family protein [Acidobacteriota bacterium]|nr:MAG: aspartate aminotransferase family protein [Acidobacteriota bacterium]
MSSKHIKLKTELPGPKSRALMEKRKKYVPRGLGQYTNIVVAKARGAILEDVDGNHLLDFASGVAVANVGHCAEKVVKAVQRQAARAMHTNFNIAPYERAVELAGRLASLTPGSFTKRALLVNSGAEAVENTVKISRASTKRPSILCFEHAFHGRTYMSMTLTHRANPFKMGYSPFCTDVHRAPYPYVYRWPGNKDSDVVADECFQFFSDIAARTSPGQIAAVIIEPMLGEGGFVPAPKKFLQKLQAFCRKHGIVFAVDEIQTGFGRTGTLFACEQLGLEPDIMILSKGIGGGMPIGAVVGRAKVMDAAGEDGIECGSYGGNAVSSAAALATLDLFKSGSLVKNARKIGKTLEPRFAAWKEKYKFIGDVRGMGSMQAMEFVKDRRSKEPDPEKVNKLLDYCYERGLIVISAGTYNNVVRLLTPLVTEPDQLEEGLEIMESGLQAIA